MANSSAREIAYDVLRRVEAEGAYATDLLHAELGSNVQANDAALATELTMGVLRWRRLLDFLLERNLDKPVSRLDLPVALSLRIGLYQLRFLERIPARATVNESVDLVKRARKTSAGSLVNAVLRRMAPEAKSPVEKMLPDDLSPADRLGILYSHSSWMVERWLARLGRDETVAVLEANNRTRRLSCSPANWQNRDEIIRELERFGETALTGDAVSLALVRELGPAITALLVAGRNASGIASELGSMVVTEQVDAMRALGTDPLRKLVTPRVVAMVLMLPLLVVVADFVGLIGGFIVAYFTLRLGPVQFWTRAIDALDFGDLVQGFAKPIIFGFIISTIGCFEGLRVTGGTQGVGRATTTAVVVSSVWVLVADFFLARLLLFLFHNQ